MCLELTSVDGWLVGLSVTWLGADQSTDLDEGGIICNDNNNVNDLVGLVSCQHAHVLLMSIGWDGLVAGL